MILFKVFSCKLTSNMLAIILFDNMNIHELIYTIEMDVLLSVILDYLQHYPFSIGNRNDRFTKLRRMFYCQPSEITIKGYPFWLSLVFAVWQHGGCYAWNAGKVVLVVERNLLRHHRRRDLRCALKSRQVSKEKLGIF